ncbi:MAG: type II toxin-antitoxin system VapC family toxin [Thermoprotei archaeon]
MHILTIDTNMWAYYFDRDSPEHELVVEEVEKALRSEQIAVNTIIIMEVAHFLVKNLGPIIGGEKLNVFLRFPLTIYGFDYKDSLDSLEMLKRYTHLGVGGRDATILAMMKAEGVKKIMTHDKAFKKIDWLHVIDPIAIRKP